MAAISENLSSSTNFTDGSTQVMPPPSRLPQTSLAACLPEELLSHIFNLAIDVTSEWDSRAERTSPHSSLTALTTVCKAWVQPARRAFYKDLSGTTLYLSAWPILLHETLQRSNQALGRLVRNFDPGDIFEESGTIAFLRMLEAMPNLKELSIYAHHIQKLCKGQHWENIQSLFVQWTDNYEDENYTDVYADQLPAKLTKLGLEGRVRIFSSSEEDGSDRSQLPQIKSLHIENARRSIPEPARFLPSMPNLEMLEITGNRQVESSRAIVQEFALSLKKLRIHQYGHAQFPLDPSTASRLKNLESLEYFGYTRSDAERISADCFPVNLRRLDITWKGRSQFTMDILSLFYDGQFLPNLEGCPRIVHTLSHDEQIETLRERRIAHYTAASKAYQQLLRRPKIVYGERIGHQSRSYPSADDVFCLPSPLPYLKSLHWQTRELLETLTASGQISGYSAC